MRDDGDDDCDAYALSCDDYNALRLADLKQASTMLFGERQ